ncbi:hypothetical protein JYU34_002076 [Plutella xylostella]|uniref:Uncharacterized protein n=1 Tax=Plutella xylostella TaxID=51655 RepID=A0ABQ7R5G4_PLUXY|nr:hypothetical protein JYU34_002076 [Plutella xylostella]
MAAKMMMDWAGARACDRASAGAVLRALAALAACPRTARTLLRGHGLLAWLRARAREPAPRAAELLLLLRALLRGARLEALRAARGAGLLAGGAPREDVALQRALLAAALAARAAAEPAQLLAVARLACPRALKALSRRQMAQLVAACSPPPPPPAARLLARALAAPALLRSSLLRDLDPHCAELKALLETYLQ